MMLKTTVDHWWQDRAPRERWLTLVMGVLLALAVLQLGIMRPLQNYREIAAQRRVHAEALFEEIRQGAQKAKGQVKTVQSSQPLRTAAAVAARAHNLTISRIQPGKDGLTLYLDSVEGPQFFAWMLALRDEAGAHVTRLTLGRNDDGKTLRAQIVLAEGQ